MALADAAHEELEQRDLGLQGERERDARQGPLAETVGADLTEPSARDVVQGQGDVELLEHRPQGVVVLALQGDAR